MRRTCVVAVAITLIAGSSAAQTNPLVGYWRGEQEAPGMRFHVEVAMTPDGHFSSIAQSQYGMMHIQGSYQIVGEHLIRFNNEEHQPESVTILPYETDTFYLTNNDATLEISNPAMPGRAVYQRSQ